MSLTSKEVRKEGGRKGGVKLDDCKTSRLPAKKRGKNALVETVRERSRNEA